MSKAIVQNYKNILDAKKGLMSWQADDLPIFPVIAMREDWYLYSTHFTKLRDDVTTLLAQESIDAGILQEMPYTIVSISELERALQVVAVSGIPGVFTSKTSEASRDWGLLTFLHNYFSEELRTTKALLVPDDAQSPLSELDTGRSGQVSSPRNQPVPDA